MIDAVRVQNLTLLRPQSSQIWDLHQISFFKHFKPVQELPWTCFSNTAQFYFCSVFSQLGSQLFSQDLSRSCNILPLVNITRSCNPVIIQPLTRHSQDLNIIQSPCFLPSHWPPSHLRASDWLMRTDVTSLTLWQLSPVTSRSQSQTMNTPGTRQRSRLRRGALLWQMTNKMDIKDVIFVHLLRRDDDQYSCLSSVACNHFPVIESP